MKYQINITAKAARDLHEAADYIEYTLLNSKAADDLLDKVETEIQKLVFMTQKHSIIDDPVFAAWEIRMIAIRNYLAFYVIDEDEKTVYIVRFLYGKRNWNDILRNGLR